MTENAKTKEPKIFAKLAKALAEMPDKLEQAQGYGYKYTPLPVIMKAVKPVLAKHGLSLMQRTTAKVAEGNEYLAVETIVFDGTGEMVSSGELFFQLDNIINKGNIAQSGGAIITYLRRYSLSALLGLATEEDTDAHPQGAYKEKKIVKQEPKPTPKKEYPPLPDTIAFLLDELGYTDSKKIILWKNGIDKYGDEAESKLLAWVNKLLDDKEGK